MKTKLDTVLANGEKAWQNSVNKKIKDMNTYYLVFDVESIGLHGEAYAVAGIVIDQTGFEHRAFKFSVDPKICAGDMDDHFWVKENVPSIQFTHESTKEMRDDFWDLWKTAKEDFPGIAMAAECSWPVEAGFLSACVRDDRHERKWEGPYPLHDVASFMQAAGMDPMATYDRLPSEEPKHCPLADSRQSARLLIEALEK